MKLILRWKELLSWVTMITIIMLTDTVLFTQNSNSLIITINSATIILLAAISILKICLKTNHLNSDLTLEFVSLICLFITMIVTGEGISSYALKACLILISINIAQSYTLELFSKRFVAIMRIIAIVSLFTFFFGTQISSMSILPVIISNTGKIYRTAFFSNICMSAFNRNFGPFWEPGAYQFYLILALILRHFCINDSKNIVFDTLVFSLALVTTFSTTGIIALLAFYVCLALSNQSLKVRYKSLLLLIIAAFTVYVLTNDYANEMIFGKLSQGMQRASVAARVYSNEGLLKVFLQNPVFGAGMSGTPVLLNQIYGVRVSITNAILVNFAEFGFIYGVIQAYFIYKFSLNIMKDQAKWKVLLCIVSIVLSLVGESFMLSLMVTGVFLLRRESFTTQSTNKAVQSNGDFVEL